VIFGVSNRPLASSILVFDHATDVKRETNFPRNVSRFDDTHICLIKNYSLVVAKMREEINEKRMGRAQVANAMEETLKVGF
jgi:hypothetical protein